MMEAINDDVDTAEAEADADSRAEVRLVGADADGQITVADAAAEAGVDRSVITRLRAVARDGAIAALQASRPGRPRRSRQEATEAAALRAEVDRLQATIVEQAVELAVLRGKSHWG